MSKNKNTHINAEKIDKIIKKEIADYRFETYLKSAIKANDLKKIFGSFIYLGEITILAGQTNVGKSILGYTIADGISKGTNILGQTNECEPLKLIYFDFELNKAQMKHRASGYKPNDNFLRPDGLRIMNDNDWVFNIASIREALYNYNPKVIIIDNLSLITDKTIQDADTAHKLMLELKSINFETGVTIIAIAHTPKIQENRLMNIYDIAGSSKLHNITDAAIMIGKSSEENNYSIIKQVKTRNSDKIPEVMVVEVIEKPWLHFEYIKFDEEKNHIKFEESYEKTIAKYRDLAQKIYNNKELSFTKFKKKYAEKTGKSEENGRKIHEKLKRWGIIKKNESGKWVCNIIDEKKDAS